MRGRFRVLPDGAPDVAAIAMSATVGDVAVAGAGAFRAGMVDLVGACDEGGRECFGRVELRFGACTSVDMYRHSV